MARKKKGQRKLEDMLDCGIELIAEKGKRGTRQHVEASVQKLGDSYVVQIGTRKHISTKLSDVMATMNEFTDFDKWLGIEPENKYATKTSEVEVIELDLTHADSVISKRRKRKGK